MGDLYREINDLKNSCMNYTLCLKLNQFDFEAFQNCVNWELILESNQFSNSTPTYSKNNINNAFTNVNVNTNTNSNNEGPTIPDLTNPLLIDHSTQN